MKEIRRIIAAYDQIDHSKEKVALASVVKIEASSYRRIGARMLVSSTGNWVGGISGGCLEGDALKRSQLAIFKNTPSTVVYDTMEDDENQIGVGLGCNGRVEVLFTPIDPLDTENEIEQLRKVTAIEQPAVMLKIIQSNYSDLLGKSQIVNEGAIFKDFYGINTEQLRQHIVATQSAKKPQIVEVFNEVGEQQNVLIEFIKPETRLVIVGDNYDVNALLGIANELGWEIYLIGKAKKLSKFAYQIAKKVLDYKDVADVPIHDYTAIVLMSHDYKWDKTMLSAFLQKQPKYIGMLGPKKRREKMQYEQGLQNYNLSKLVNLYSPVGLDIGAESPEEIALSIVSEIVAVFRKREGKSLKFRAGTIHERGA